MSYGYYDTPPDVSTEKHYSVHPVGVAQKKPRGPRRPPSIIKQVSRALSSVVNQSVRAVLSVGLVAVLLWIVYHNPESPLASTLVSTCFSVLLIHWFPPKGRSK